MQSIILVIQIYAMSFIIAFFVAVMIKVLLFLIRYVSGATSKKPQDAH
ncbi:hypothetical protein ASZ90_019212 [hydrocarbon metagenome]|uniref:Uncharacterized protein n=1 Tax=hydrocarbon metagenome TaxID=938273 RepID=A0A0W8E440_9ZZZZ